MEQTSKDAAWWVWCDRTYLRDALLPLFWLAVGLLLSFAYLVGAALVTVPARQIVPVYPQQAVILSVLLLTPRARWWLYLLTAYAILVTVRLWLGAPAWFVLSGSVPSIVEPLVGALMVRHFMPLPPRFARLREVGIYAACTIAAAALGALLGAAVRLGLGSSYWPSWRDWFLSDALASLLLAPTILLWIEAGVRGLRPDSRQRAAEAALLSAALLAVTLLQYGTRTQSPDTAPALLYLPVPVLLWAAVRFGPRGVATGLAFVTAVTIAAVANGLGPMPDSSTAANLITLQIFLFAVGVPMFFLAVLVQERQEAQEALKLSEARYREAQDQRETLTQELTHVTRVASLGELVSSIAHELAQPLTAILSNAQAGRELLAAPGSTGPDLAEIDAVMADIGADGERASAVLTRLRSLLRKRTVEWTPLDLNAAVADTSALVAPDARRRGAVLALDLEPGLPLVEADRVQLQQVILNLLLNGLDAVAGVSGVADTAGMPTENRPRMARAPATLSVRTHLAVGREAGGRREVEVVVRDNGPGIDPAVVERLFEPFYTTKSTGLGMGLTICRTIVEAHGGRLWAESHPGGGAVFTIALPLPGPATPNRGGDDH
jgi:signal transduction histidine kinase